MPAIIPIPAFTDNYIWLLREGSEAVVVDPGDADPVLAYLDQSGLALRAILNTHHHRDHVGGNLSLLQRFAVPVFGPAGEAIPGRSRGLREGEEVDVPGIELRFRVIDVPGHTAGHIAYLAAAHTGHAPLALVGDTLFAAGCGRLFEGTAAQMSASLAKLAALPAETRVYCAHEYTVSNLRFARAVEPDNSAIEARMKREQARRARDEPTVPSTIAEELATNPFLRTGEPGVIAAAQRHAGRALHDRAEIFAALRAWKDRF